MAVNISYQNYASKALLFTCAITPASSTAVAYFLLGNILEVVNWNS